MIESGVLLNLAGLFIENVSLEFQILACVMPNSLALLWQSESIYECVRGQFLPSH